MEDIRYSRQTYTLGKQASTLVHKSNILVIGYSSLSLEIIKNLVLTGINSIDIYINSKIKLEKYQKTGLYYGDIVNKEALEKLKCLNPSVLIQTIFTNIGEIDYTKYNLVIVTNMYFNDAITINEKTREYNIPFILCGCNGLMAFMFNDFGNKYHINDIDGETYDLLYIDSINENRIKFKENHSLGNGDILTTISSTGTHYNREMEYIVKNIISPTEIDLTTDAAELLDAEIKVLIKKKENYTLNFSSLQESIIKPSYNEYTERTEILHILNKSYNDFYNMNKRIPRVQNDVDCELFMEYVYKYNKEGGISNNIEKLGSAYCKSIRGNVLPFVSIIAGIVSQEAIKVLGSIYMPINQWLYIDYLDLIKDNTKIKLEKSEYYEGYVNVFGKDAFNKIQNTKIFIAGAGAIGCELLKQTGSLGIRNITITDMDNIEKSNLSRQFLFSDRDINKSKSITAMNKINELFTDKNIKINAREYKLCKETETIFNAIFYNNVDIILNALDNVEARKYVDQQAIKYSKPLIDSGTMGTKGNVQVILPYLTETYGTMEDPDDDKGIPICTIKSFPYKNEHTIQWARELFEQEFTFPNINATDYVDNMNNKDVDNMNNNDVDNMNNKDVDNMNNKDVDNMNNKDVEALYKQYYKYENFTLTYESYAYVLHCIFIDNYYKNIMELIEKHKNDEIPKKLPILLNLEKYKELVLEYYIYGFSLLNQIFYTNISHKPDYNHKLDLFFKPYGDIAHRDIAIDIKREKCKNILNSLRCIKNKINFNKDDDMLNHVDWLVVISNLRNLQYSIPLTDKYETRKIAGKIIPALITTTSIIAGYQIMEFIKTVLLMPIPNTVIDADIDIMPFTNIYLNTGINFFSYVTPTKINKKIVSNSMMEISVWDKIIIPKSITHVAHILDIVSRKVLTKVEFMSWKSNIVYDGNNIIINNIDLTESNAVILLKEYSNQDDNKFIELIIVHES
jgi:ubiquitin-activating enzyme E1